MITLYAEDYNIKLTWQCPTCKKWKITSIEEFFEGGWPLCDCSSIKPPRMEITSYLISNKLDDILSHIAK